MFRQPDWTSYKTILLLALFVRIVAAIFSQGYGMHDDHFLVVEASASWTDGYDYNHWLPWTPESTGHPEGHSFSYVGLNFFYFYLFKWFGISDPKILMLFNRIFHALFSLLVVYFGIKISEKLSDKKTAVTVGWILALLWLFPFISVRNLVEVACIPFLMWGTWLLIKNDLKKNFFIAGSLVGMAVSFRYQIGVFALGMAAVLFFQWKWDRFWLFSLGVTTVFCLTQGLVDFIIWGYPFAELMGYFMYNINEGTEYIPNDDYFMYLYVLMGACLLPLGLLLGLGFFRSGKKYALIFVPVLLFIIFHSLYPSKQERFILPVLPLFIILGVLGYRAYFNAARWEKIWRFSYRFFWVINIPLLAFVSVSYSKKSRVEAMYYFYENQEIPIKILLEGTGESGISMIPKFYSGVWKFGAIERINKEQDLSVIDGYVYDYILFYDEENLTNRVAEYQTIYPKMELKKQCQPSFFDRFLRWLNPRNSNEYIEVWKTNETPI